MSTINQTIKKVAKCNLIGYKAHHPLFFENAKFIIKTAENYRELRRACKLRYQVFYKELQHKRKIIKLDIDEYDRQCDHILVIDKKSGKCVGTYRLNLIKEGTPVYSDHEFDVSAITNLPGVKLELGRACVRSEFRSGAVFMLIWKAILQYAESVQADYMFGCSSVQTTDVIDAGLCHWWLKQKHNSDISELVTPRDEFKIPKYERLANFVESSSESYGDVYKREAEALIPPLLKFYLKNGAKICGEPALDKDFHCVDFLTCMDVREMSAGLKRRK